MYILGRSKPFQSLGLPILLSMRIETRPHPEMVLARINLIAALCSTIVYQKGLLLSLTFMIGQLM